MRIRFTNGTNFEYIRAFETEEHFNGASRRTLTFECPANAISVDELNNALSNEANTAELELINAERNTSAVYSGYVLKLKCGIESKLVSVETPETPAVYEDRLIFKLGKRTFIEEQLKRLGL